ncbi:MAG: phage portal protein, partial [Fusobacteriaceae bacterium]
MFKAKAFEQPSELMIKELLEFHQSKLERYTKLQNYYLGKQDIFNRVAVIEDNSNIKSMTNFCKLITDTMTAYLLANP